MAFGAMILLVGLALLVAAIIALLFDSRTRPWAAGLLLISVPLAAVALGYIPGIRAPASSAAWPQNTAFEPLQPIHTSTDVAPYFIALIVLLALVTIFYFIFAADKSWFRQHVGSAGGWALVVIGVVLVALLAPPRKWFDVPFTPNTTRPTNYRTVAETSPPLKAESPTKEKQIADVASSSTKTSSEKPDTSNRPDWVNQPPSKQGDSYVVSVASGVYADPGMRDQMLDAKMVAAANRYVDEVVYHQPGVADALALDADYLQNFLRDRSISPAKDETFVQLVFNKRFRDEIEYRYRQFISLGRLEQLGGGALGALALLGGLYCYLRLTQPPRASAVKPAEISA